MKMKKWTALVLTVFLFFGVFAAGLPPAADAAGKYSWVSVWGSSLVNGSVKISQLSLQDVIPGGSTLRIRLTVTRGGSALRFVFANQYGAAPITIHELSVAKAGKGDDEIVDGTQQPITFNGGKTSVSVPNGGRVTSDVVDIETKALEEICVSMHFKNLTYMTSSGLSGGRTFMQAGGVLNGTISAVNNVRLKNPGEVNISSSTITYHTIPFLERVDSRSAEEGSCAVFIGDSTLVNDTYLYYAKRIIDAGATNVSVINEAIIGNKLLSNGSGLIGNLYGQALIDRFKRDVLDIPGVKYCFVKIGLNDILHQFSKSLGSVTPHYTPQQIITGYRTLITLCHQKGIKIYFFTKSPWKGYQRSFLGQTDDVSWTQTMQDMCEQLNDWITSNKEADGFIDCFPLANPADPYALCPSFTPDGAHLTDVGSIAMADLIPLDFVGVTHGRTAASILGVDPYAEKAEIIRRMNDPNYNPNPVTPVTPVNPTTPTTSPYSNIPTVPTSPYTPSNPGGTVFPTVPSNPALPTVPSDPTLPTVPTAPAGPGSALPSDPAATVPTTPGSTIPGSTIPGPTAPTAPYEAPATVYPADPANPNQGVRYDVEDVAPNAPASGSVGSTGSVLFILLLLATVVGVGVAVILTITKKKA